VWWKSPDGVLMVRRVGEWSIPTKLVVAIVGCSLLFVGYAVVSLLTLAELRVGGPRFDGIVLANELTADVLPPPAYLVETNMVVLAMLGPAGDGDREALAGLVDQEQRLHRDYDARLGYWTDKLTDPTLRELVLTTSDGAAQRYFDLVEQQYIPLVEQGSIDEAERLVYGEIADTYQEHRAAIDEVVSAATAQASEQTVAAVSQAATRSRLLVGGLVGTVVITCAVAVGVARKIAVGSIAGFVTDLASASDQLASTATGLQLSLATTSHEIITVSNATDQASRAVATAAAASEQMTVTVDRITDTMTQVSELTAHAVELSGTAATAITELVRASSGIDDIVGFIIDVAQQTNMLALNATIEGARAGHAGRGFEVVAGEVKALAHKTGDATTQIQCTIDVIQQKAGEAVRVIQSFAQAMDQVNAGQQSVARSINEQAAAMAEITQVAAEVAAATTGIAASISAVADATNAAAAGATQVSQSATTVATMATDLRHTITWNDHSPDTQTRADKASFCERSVA
jgi:Methyl-accepting chemotaxis protein (MCP) signalling domain